MKSALGFKKLAFEGWGDLPNPLFLTLSTAHKEREHWES